ncbi:hypothetical protein C8J56DRAFT_1056742 [Mycena floridula]|nr:hypothetical protein C8J56DRAFT_1056742 [Mycena floridula]
MSTRDSSLEVKNALLQQKIASQRAQIAALQRALQSFTQPLNNDGDDDILEEEAPEDGKDDSDKEEEDNGYNDQGPETGATDPPTAQWDEYDQIYRCSNCFWEIDDGTCPCYAEFDIPMTDTNATWSVTASEAAQEDRCTASRGNTPTLPIEKGFVPAEYSNPWTRREEEYEQLLRRGATRIMCETFHLEFTNDEGIVAWADSDLYEAFSGPPMQVGDFWKIYLGRRIQLDSQDSDGSQFIEDLLEDISDAYYTGCGCWRTTEEAPGIWATRLLRIPQRLGEVSEEPPLSFNFDYYESDSDAEGDVDMEDSSAIPQWLCDELASDDSGSQSRDSDEESSSVEIIDDDMGAISEQDVFDSDFDSTEHLSGDESIFPMLVAATRQ